MATPTLNAHYSLSTASWRAFGFLCFALFFFYFPRHIAQHEETGDIRLELVAAGFLCASLVDFYHLLIARKRPVMSIGGAGFRDTRMSAAVIPWSAVKSMRPYLKAKNKEEIGVTVEIDPAFWQTLPLGLIFKCWRFANMESGTSANLLTGTLDVSSGEVLRVAGAYTLIKTHDWLQDVFQV